MGFSHKHWIEGYQAHSSHHIRVFGLPARHWKWRMHGGAIALADQLTDQPPPQLLLVSAMIDLPLFRSLLPKSYQGIPMAVYFHENQFAYPRSAKENKSVDHHYGFINLKSALAADKAFFNSQYNLNSFVQGCRELLKKMPDEVNDEWVDQIASQCQVLPLGMDFFDRPYEKTTEAVSATQPPQLLWNHRWEHDKNPELFFETLIELQKEGLQFRLAVLGEEFRDSPAVFEKAKKVLQNEITTWGFQDSRKKYEQVVTQSSILPVTSNQDFFGISILEAVHAGVRPLLPNRLAYPEHFNEDFFYNSDLEFKEKLRTLISDYKPIDAKTSRNLERYSWNVMAAKYDEEFSSITSAK